MSKVSEGDQTKTQVLFCNVNRIQIGMKKIFQIRFRIREISSTSSVFINCELAKPSKGLLPKPSKEIASDSSFFINCELAKQKDT